MKTLAFLAAVGAAAAFAAPAQAALVGCPADFTADGTAKVFNGDDTAVSACQYLTPPDSSNVASVDNINAAGFFGYSDWEDNGQTQVGDDVGLSGSWFIDAVDFEAYDYMMVFKDGSDTNLIAFLFNEEFASGDWSTPFTEPPFDFPGGGADGREVSHWTIVRRAGEPPIDVPEPAMLGLLGLGLAGIGFARRRRG